MEDNDITKKRRCRIFYIGWHIILSILAVFAFVFTLRNNVFSINFSIENIMHYMGVIATTIGIVVTGFFVILAIDMFSIYRDIKSTKEKLHKDTVDFQNRKKEYNKILEDFAQSLLDGLDTQIGLASSPRSNSNTSLLKNLPIKRARLSYQYPMLNMCDRIRLLTDLGSIGEIQDIIPVQNIIENENEPETIKTVAKEVMKRLKERLGIL